MAIVELSNLTKPVAIGLEWHALPGNTSQRKEVDAIAQQENMKFGCVLTDDDAGVTVVGLSADKREGVACGAAWLARVSNREALILVEPLPDGRLWMCAVRAGLPVQGLDSVIEVSQLHERLHEFLREAPESKVCSTVAHLDQAYSYVVPQSFAELVTNTKPEKIKRISGLNPVLVGLMVAILLLTGSWYAFDTYQADVKRELAKSKLLQLDADQKRQEAERIAKLQQQHREAGEAMIRSVVLDKPAVDVLMGAIFAELLGKPLSLSGWSLAGYDCDAQACSLMWQRGKTGTALGFIKAAEKHGWEVVKVSGVDAVSAHPISAPGRAAPLTVLDPDLAFRAALETKLQQAAASGLTYDLGQSEPLEKSLPQPAPPEKGAPPPVALEPLPWKVGTVMLKGSRLFELREIPEYVAHGGVSVKNIRGDVKANEWTMELNYATR